MSILSKEEFDKIYGEHKVFLTKRYAKQFTSKMSKWRKYNVKRASDVEILPIPTYSYETYPKNLHSQYRWYIKVSEYLNKGKITGPIKEKNDHEKLEFLHSVIGQMTNGVTPHVSQREKALEYIDELKVSVKETYDVKNVRVTSMPTIKGK